ncbi:MAG: T9SS type A sorting domain-containing protein [Muribaculaceae bacterium]
MRKLFISAVVFLSIVANQNTWANGSLRTGGESFIEQTDEQTTSQGTFPFSLTLIEDVKSVYTPGFVDADGNYTDGTNTFTNTLVAAETASHEEIALTVGATLELTRKLANRKKPVVVSSYTVTDATMTLAQLVSKIGANGTFTESFNATPGAGNDATYQLCLTIGSDVYYSNTVDIVGTKVSNSSVGIHRSGTPDAATCAATELFHNEISFTPANTGVGTGYYIYCNGEKVLTLTDGGNRKFSDENGTEYVEDENGVITVVLYPEASPISVGETKCGGYAFFSYSVVHFDNKNNTYGSEAFDAEFIGATNELVVDVPSKTSTLHYNNERVFIRPIIRWELQQSSSDVATPIGYQVWRKIEKATFELNNEENSGATSNVNEDNLGTYEMVASFDNTVTLYSDEIYYARRNQTTSTLAAITEDEVRSVSYYVKAIYSDDEEVAQNEREKNSAAVAIVAAEGGIFTSIEDVQAQGVAVVAENGLITVTGVQGTINVYNAAGQLVATANSNGDVTDIDASRFNGVYVVKAQNMTMTTKVLIK